nr:DUF169 domain-containing protein [Candidatus Njordarchaeum guaymaensis]
MDKSTLNEKLIRLLRLRASPVAVNLLKTAKEIPSTIKVPSSGYTFCQLVALARLNGGVQAGTADSIVCAFATSVLGMTDFPEDIRTGKRPLRTSRSEEGYAKFVSSLPKIKTGTFEAVITSPLHKAPLDPSIVIVSGTPAQMMRLLNAITWISGERIQFSSTGHAGVCAEGVAAPYLAKRPQLGIPCMGGRMFGLHQDDEMLIGIPGEQLEGIVKAVEETEKAGLTFPVIAWICPPKGLALMPIAKKM